MSEKTEKTRHATPAIYTFRSYADADEVTATKYFEKMEGNT